MIRAYWAADLLLLHLNDYEAFGTVLPSKVFEYASLGKPGWAGVTGYAAQFLRDEVSNAAVLDPCDAEEALRAFGRSDFRDVAREEFVRKSSLRGIMKAMTADVVGCVAQEVVE